MKCLAGELRKVIVQKLFWNIFNVTPRNVYKMQLKMIDKNRQETAKNSVLAAASVFVW
jgi:hypothetical protein